MIGLQHLQVAETTAINFISPVFITALSIPLLGEKVGARRWAAAGVGFAGVMLIVRPGSDAFQLAALYPIGAALVWAFAAIATRFMSRERPETTLAYSAIVGLAVLTCLVPFQWAAMSLHDLGFAVLTGVASTIGHWLLIRGYRLASASILAPYSYVQLLFASLFGFAAFGVDSGLLDVHRRRRHRGERPLYRLSRAGPGAGGRDEGRIAPGEVLGRERLAGLACRTARTCSPDAGSEGTDGCQIGVAPPTAPRRAASASHSRCERYSNSAAASVATYQGLPPK